MPNFLIVLASRMLRGHARLAQAQAKAYALNGRALVLARQPCQAAHLVALQLPCWPSESAAVAAYIPPMFGAPLSGSTVFNTKETCAASAPHFHTSLWRSYGVCELSVREVAECLFADKLRHGRNGLRRVTKKSLDRVD